MKLLLEILLIAFCLPIVAAVGGQTADFERQVFAEKDTFLEERHLQDEAEETEEDVITFQLKMWWQEGYQ